MRFDVPLELGISVEGDPEIVPRTPLAAAAFARGMPGLYTFDRQGYLYYKSYNVIGGSTLNYVADDVSGATISGGGWLSGASSFEYPNRVLGSMGTVGGGSDNEVGDDYGTIAGGSSNRALGRISTIGGGATNNAAGEYATIPGGQWNSASGDNSFAAGTNAHAAHEGSFVWSDHSQTAFADSFKTTGVNQFLLQAAGGVGIGTNAPDEQLHILEAEDSTAVKLGGGGTPGPNGIVFDDDQTGKGVSLFFRTVPNRLVLEPTSKGTHTDTVDVFYFDRDTREFGFGGEVYPTGNDLYDFGSSRLRWKEIFTGTVVNTSDERLKRNVRELPRGLRDVLDMRPVAFEWIHDESAATQLGLIAQEVEEVIPEVVSAPETVDDRYGLNYAALVPVLIKAIQEQQELIEAQNRNMAAQNERIAELERRIVP